jgi:Cu(I)/Ag(I) efflux system membrane fusion protein
MAMRRLMRFILIFILGAAVGLTGAYAHLSGRLDPIYHKLGWHALATRTERREEGGNVVGGHAGHEGMNMPGMDMPATSMVGAEPSNVPGHATVTISPERQQLIGVRKGNVVRDELVMSIRAVGIIEPDQMKLARVQTRVKGWVTKVLVNFVGQNVRKGDPLVEIYSPDLLETQQEYLIALKHSEKAGQAVPERSLAESAIRRLKLLGVPDDEIEELEQSRKARDTLTLRSPVDGRVLDRSVLEGSYVEPANELYRIADLSIVWLQAKLYEYEIPHIEVDQPVTVTLLSEPDAEFHGRVSFVEPVVQEMTRTVKVRVEVKNPNDSLKPGMYADLKIEHDMGKGLLIPEAAVLRTGERDLAFRVRPEGRFEPVEVKLGSRFGERFEVREGLKEGDEIVTSAGFLIDSESRLKSTSAAGGHKHGG